MGTKRTKVTKAFLLFAGFAVFVTGAGGARHLGGAMFTGCGPFGPITMGTKRTKITKAFLLFADFAASRSSWLAPGARVIKMPEAESGMDVYVRPAEAIELDELAQVWFDGWRDAHAAIVPAELTRVRTREAFRERLEAALADTRVVGPVRAPAGFAVIKDDELYQLFVTAAARGTGVAAALLADAEARLAGKGVATAWLACAIGNMRAARFYEKHGWHLADTFVSHVPVPDGTFALEVWRYEKPLVQR